VYGFISYRLRDRDTAEDLTQLTFERALRAWSRFDPNRSSETTWLMAIARNLLIDHYRSDKSARHQPLDEEAAPMVPGPEERFSATPAVVEALTQLSDREREIVALRFGGDLAGAEIAAVLGLTIANVQQIMSRSLRKLRTLLETQLNRESTTSRASEDP
jgi:RNA polymerase sigma factor (sigma-70 family)